MRNKIKQTSAKCTEYKLIIEIYDTINVCTPAETN